MPASKSVKLNTGADMPTVGLGTWKSAPGAVEHAVEFALRNGYTHIDSKAAFVSTPPQAFSLAWIGFSCRCVQERERGRRRHCCVRCSSRLHLFLTTKLDNPDQKEAPEALESSLKNLGTDYLDLCTPQVNDLLRKPDTYMSRAHALARTNDKRTRLHLQTKRTTGLTPGNRWRHCTRVTRISSRRLVSPTSPLSSWSASLAVAEVVPAVNQIEMHPSCPSEDVLEFCRKKGIVVTAYSPLGSDNSPLLTNEIVTKLAEKYNVTPANILISLQANKPGVTVLPKSVTNSRILSNAVIIDLTDEEIKELHKIDETHHFRACHPSWTGWGGLGFPDCK
ncbi:Aldo-ket-red domain-containing protein [Mycena venus]|uniref:Aldo-ket-red domain-containing protein n=1 Tax=Mycena venus TaxID=2733690 RepID=A0A8H6YIJ9_9AGAR|nr:Aldo-ket-red domain-containing protein [Mycena venus]